MTKKNADAISRYLDLRCDQSYLFVTQVGTGAFSRTKVKGHVSTLLTLLLKIINDIMEPLKQTRKDSVAEMICLALLKHLADGLPDNPPPKPAEDLTGKQLARRIKRNELILSEVEAAL